MANGADTRIVIGTQLDNKGFKAGSKQLLSAMTSLSRAINGLGPSFKRAMGGGEAAVTSFIAKTDALENRISHLRQNLDALGKNNIQTEKYHNLVSEMSKAESALNRLYDKQEKMQNSGVKESSKQWRNLQFEIQRAEEQMARYEARKTQLESSGKAFVSGVNTAQYQQMEAELNSLINKLTQMRERIDRGNSGWSRMLQLLKRIASSSLDKFISGLKSAAKHMGTLVKKTFGLRNPFSGLTSSMKRLIPSLLMTEGIMGLLRKAVNAYMQQNQQLAATLSSCWSGIGNLLGPIITRLINLIATAVSYVTQFLSLLGLVGSKTSKAISGAGGSAKKETDKLKRTLASFDELTILQNNDEDRGGGGGGSAAAELSQATLPDWAKLMAEHLKEGNWKAAATVLTSQLNEMVASVDWAGVGDKIAYYLDGALESLATTILTFDWKSLGTNLATSFNHILSGVDWANLGVVLGGRIIALLRTASGFVTTFKWKELGKAVSDAIMGLWNAIDWKQAAKTLSDGLIGVLNALSSALAGVDWQKVARDVAIFISTIDWSGVFTALCTGIGAAVGGIGSFVWGLICEAFSSAKAYFDPYIEELGGDVIGGILVGILNALLGIGQWIVDNIFTPFIDGFKAAFGIHSPSTVMEEQGGFIIAGLLNGLTDAWNDIVSFFSEKLTGITDTVKGAWGDIKADASQKWASISSDLSKTWTDIKGMASDTVTSIKSSFESGGWKSIGSNICSGISNGINSGWSWLKTTVKNLANNLLSTAKSALGIHSPSRLFRDQVGLNIGYGVGEGIEASEGSILDSVCGVADAIADEFNANEYQINGAVSDAEIDSTLTGFADKIADSFTALMDRMQAIAESISFKAPEISLGTVVPVSVPAAVAASDTSDTARAIQEKIDIAMEDFIQSNIAGHEATVAVLREILEAVLGIEIGDEVIGRAVDRYTRRMALRNGG